MAIVWLRSLFGEAMDYWRCGSVCIPEAAMLPPTTNREIMTFGLYQKLDPAGQQENRNGSIDLRE